MTALRVKGFTLIELLVVVGILGILAAALLMTLDPFSQVQKGNDAKRKSDLSQIQKALETYYQDNGKYPINNPQTTYRIYDERSTQNAIIDWGSSWAPYMNLLPEDPSTSKNYVYYSPGTCPGGAGQCYFLYASLDRGDKDPQACNSGAICDSVPEAGACGADECNYGVSSTNVSP
jgi:general secretion pathway protein G